MGMEVKDKVVIVTGASGGIGEATARLLSKLGAKVVLAARSKDKLDSLSKELPESLAIPTDVTQEKDLDFLIKKTLEYFGTIDVLINNAGRGYDATTEEIDLNKFRELFELDLLSYISLMQKVISVMKKQKSGVIVNISSGTAFMALPGMGAYSSLKRAIVGISLTARAELENDGINVSVIYPYITDTDFEKNTIKNTSITNLEDSEENGAPPFPADPPEHVAEKILHAIKSGEAEVFAHDWMDKSLG